MTGDEKDRWHHQFNEHELGQTLGDGEGQGGLACCSPWGHKVGHNLGTEQTQTVLSFTLLSLLFPIFHFP